MVGGNQAPGAGLPGTVVVDSIGLGSDCVPYTYMDGTSMASPAVAGAAAAIAGTGKAEVAGDPAKSAEKLAALVKGAAQPDKRYADICSTGGYATVDGAGNPGPALTKVADAGDSVVLEGYFFTKDAQATIGDSPAPVIEAKDLGDGKVALKVSKLAGFAGGQVTVSVQQNDKRAMEKATLSASATSEVSDPEAYYDQMNLPLFEGIEDWGAWQLVGFDGKVYALPRGTQVDSPLDPGSELTHDSIQRFDPSTQQWEKLMLPAEVLAEAGLDNPAIVEDVTGATIDGSLILLVQTGSTSAFIRLTADNEWESLGYSFISVYEGPYLATLGNDGDGLYLFGGVTMQSLSAQQAGSSSILKVDFEGKQLIEAGQLTGGRIRPQVAFGDGMFVVSGGISASPSVQFGGAQGIEVVEKVDGGYDADADKPIESSWAGTPVDYTSLVTETGQLSWAAGAVRDGFAVAGPDSDKKNADTYLLTPSGEGGSYALSAYEKQASEQELLVPAALGYRGHFYVLAAAQNDPYRTFSATAMETDPQPGDAPEESGDDNPDEIPWTELTPATPIDSTSGDEPSADGDGPEDGGLTKLARTGDPLDAWAMPVIVLAAALAAIVASAGTVVARRRKARR